MVILAEYKMQYNSFLCVSHARIYQVFKEMFCSFLVYATESSWLLMLYFTRALFTRHF